MNLMEEVTKRIEAQAEREMHDTVQDFYNAIRPFMGFGDSPSVDVLLTDLKPRWKAANVRRLESEVLKRLLP